MTRPTGNALGEFLRARRDATRPAAVGLPVETGRRAPGLRRAELAALAGVSVEYLTRLERGADRHPSPEVLAALARVMAFTPDEHVHALRLVKVTAEDCAADRSPAVPRPGVLALLDRLGDTPAAVVDRVGTVLARSTGFALLYPPDVVDLPTYVVTDPRARATLPDHDAVVEEWAVRLRAAADLGHRRAHSIAESLALRVPDFAHRYARAARVPAWTGIHRTRDVDDHLTVWSYEALELPETEEDRLLVHLPAVDAQLVRNDG